jgi:hypothetical protein
MYSIWQLWPEPAYREYDVTEKDPEAGAFLEELLDEGEQTASEILKIEQPML